MLVDGQAAGQTQTITDVGRLAVEQSRAQRDQRIAHAVARRILKKSTVYAAKDALAVGGGMVNFAMDAAGVLWEATEKADTRNWSLLPGQIQVLRLELPAGVHQLALQPTRGGRPLDAATSTTVEVVDGRNSYVLGMYPEGQLVGNLVVGKQ